MVDRVGSVVVCGKVNAGGQAVVKEGCVDDKLVGVVFSLHDGGCWDVVQGILVVS